MSFEISSIGDFESFDYPCRGNFRELLLLPMHPVAGSKSALGDSRGSFYLCQQCHQSRDQQKYLPHPHSVKSFKQVQRVELVLLILQSNQKWGTIKFEVNFRPLIQLNSRGLLISFDGGQLLLSRI